MHLSRARRSKVYVSQGPFRLLPPCSAVLQGGVGPQINRSSCKKSAQIFYGGGVDFGRQGGGDVGPCPDVDIRSRSGILG